jgi:hypothetical protein
VREWGSGRGLRLGERMGLREGIGLSERIRTQEDGA